MDPKSKILLTPKICVYIAKGFKLGQYFAAHPFKWNEKLNRPELTQSRIRNLIWAFNTILSISYCMFVWLRCIHMRQIEETTDPQKIRITIVAVLCAVLPCNQFLVIFRKKEIVEFLTMNLDYSEHFEKLYVKRGARSPIIIKLCEKFMEVLYTGCILNAMLLQLIANLNPKSPETLSSLIWMESPLTGEGTIIFQYALLRGVATLLLFLVSYNFVATMLLLLYSGFPLLIQVFVVLQELSSGTCQVTKGKLRVMSHSVTTFRSAQLIMNAGNEIFSISNAYMQVCVNLTIVYFSYGAIRFSGMEAVICGSIAIFDLMGISVLIGSMGQFHRHSEQLMSHWQSVVPRVVDRKHKLFTKCLKSMPTLSTTVMGIYIVDKGMVLSVFQFILESLVDLLIMYP